jgi:hypothetical protein
MRLRSDFGMSFSGAVEVVSEMIFKKAAVLSQCIVLLWSGGLKNKRSLSYVIGDDDLLSTLGAKVTL